MTRSVFIIVDGVLVGTFMAVAVLLMMPVNLNGKSGRKTCVQIGWMNLVCKNPSPNLNVTLTELTTYWKLPNDARLSPSMIETGRCEIAVNKRNEKSLQKMKYDVCYCGHHWWVPVIAIVALLCGICFCIEFMRCLAWKGAEVSMEEAIGCARHEMFRHLVIIGSLFVFMYSQTDNFTYTLYGDLFPSSYFDGFPTAWEIAMWLYVGSGIVQAACTYGLFLFIKSERCKQQERAREAKAVVKSVPMKKTGPVSKNQGNGPNGAAQVALKDETMRQQTRQSDQPESKTEPVGSGGEQPIKMPPPKMTFNKDPKDSAVPMFQLSSSDHGKESKMITEESAKEKTNAAIQMNEESLNTVDPKNA